MRIQRRMVFLSIVQLLLVAGTALAQPIGGAAVLSLEPSARAPGMGRASAAVFWGGDGNELANPALLGWHDDLQWNHGKTRFVPDLANHVYNKTDRISLGFWGAGASLGGRLIGLGRTRLDYTKSLESDEPLGKFDPYETLHSFGVGVNLLELGENLFYRRLHAPHPLSRFGDISLGYTSKRAELHLAPSWATPENVAGTGSVASGDFGLLMRLTPLDTIDGTGLLPGLKEAMDPLAARVDVAYGRAKHNLGKKSIHYVNADAVDPIVMFTRSGWALHGAIGPSSETHRSIEDPMRRFLVECLTPFLSAGVAWDRVEQDWPNPDERDVTNRGWEITLANMVTYRRGRVGDRDGGVVDNTHGIGFGLQVGRFGRIRYDHAVARQLRVLDPVRYNSFTVTVQPLEIAAAFGVGV